MGKKTVPFLTILSNLGDQVFRKGSLIDTCKCVARQNGWILVVTSPIMLMFGLFWLFEAPFRVIKLPLALVPFLLFLIGGLHSVRWGNSDTAAPEKKSVSSKKDMNNE